jgi:hypothetical protein
MTSGRKLANTLIGAYLLLASVCFAAAVLGYAQRETLPIFYWKWIAAKTFELFIRYILPVHLTAVALAISVQPRGASTSLIAAVQGQLLVIIAVAALFTFLVEYSLPATYADESRMASITTAFRNSYDDADAAFRKADYETAVTKILVCLGIDPANPAARDLQVRILRKKALAASPSGLPVLSEAGTAGTGAVGLTARPAAKAEESANGDSSFVAADGRSANPALDLFNQAQSFYDHNDFYAAHLYATRSFALDPARIDAQRLAAQAWQRISDLAPSKDSPERDLFARKMEGYAAYASNDPLAAFYVFAKLKPAYPNDPDVVKYYALSLEAVKKVSFFTDEMSSFDAILGNENILFRNAVADGRTEMVYVGKEAAIGGEEYYRDIEVMRFDSSGVKEHFSARYGKRIKDELLLFAIDRKDPTVFFKPKYYVGNPSSPVPSMLKIGFTSGEFELIAKSRRPLAQSNISELFTMEPVMARAGLDGGEVKREILYRFFLPVELLFLSICAVIAALRFRSRSEERPPFFQLLVGAGCFALVSWRAVEAWTALNRSLIDTLSVTENFAQSQAVFIAVQGALVALTVIVLAGQRTDA